MRSSIVLAPAFAAFALGQFSSISYSNPYTTETDSLGVVTGQPANTGVPASSQPSVITSQPSVATSQPSAATVPAGTPSGVVIGTGAGASGSGITAGSNSTVSTGSIKGTRTSAGSSSARGASSTGSSSASASSSTGSSAAELVQPVVGLSLAGVIFAAFL